MNNQSVLSENKHGLRIDHTGECPRFSVTDESALDDGIAHMREHGYVVLSEVIEPNNMKEHRELLWQFLEGIPHLHIRRDDPKTWHNWLGKSSFAVKNDCGIGQSDFMWSVRANRQIERIFARIWNTRDLLVSFDGCGVFRDWRYDPAWKRGAGWYDVDQNPVTKPALCSVQGFAALTDQNETTDSLVVYPKPHSRLNELCSVACESGDFVVVPGGHGSWPCCGLTHPVSRGRFRQLVHCNTPACVESERDQNDTVGLLRIVAYISMNPATFVRNRTLDQFRKKRKQMVQDKCTLNHWSPELRQASVNRYLAKISLSKLDAYQRGLIIGLDYDEE